jgi:hypothetical protein
MVLTWPSGYTGHLRAEGENRTPDHLVTNQGLYRLSYFSEKDTGSVRCTRRTECSAELIPPRVPVRRGGLEPPYLPVLEPKPSAYASSAIVAVAGLSPPVTAPAYDSLAVVLLQEAVPSFTHCRPTRDPESTVDAWGVLSTPPSNGPLVRSLLRCPHLVERLLASSPHSPLVSIV